MVRFTQNQKIEVIGIMDVITNALQSMDSDLKKIKAALDRLSTELIWRRLRVSTNSIGNLCLHLAGSEYQRFVSTIGGNPIIRERSVEFTAEGGLDSAQLTLKLEAVREEGRAILLRLTPDDLERKLSVHFQAEDWQRMLAHRPEFGNDSAYKPQKISGIIQGMANHYSYHTGQIVLLAKLLQEGEEQILQWKH
jgi:uncharacterized damage-inducible protein DinB